MIPPTSKPTLVELGGNTTKQNNIKHGIDGSLIVLWDFFQPVSWILHHMEIPTLQNSCWDHQKLVGADFLQIELIATPGHDPAMSCSVCKLSISGVCVFVYIYIHKCNSIVSLSISFKKSACMKITMDLCYIRNTQLHSLGAP